MGFFHPTPPMEETIFRMYISNVLLAVRDKDPFKGERGKQLINNLVSRIEKVLQNKRFLITPETKCPVWSRVLDINGCGYKILDEKEKFLQHYCDEILEILFSRRKDLKCMKIRDKNDFLLFLEKIFNFFLSSENLPKFVGLIFELANGGAFFESAYYEHNRIWLNDFEFKI